MSSVPPSPENDVAVASPRERYFTQIMRSVYYPALLLVLAWGTGWTVLLYNTRERINGGDVFLGVLQKQQFESAAIWVLALALVVALLRWGVSRAPSLLWLAGVLLVFLSREIHFAGTSTAVYVGIVMLFVLALFRPQWTQSLLLSRWCATLLAMVMACYLFAVSLDGRWWFDWNDQWKAAAVLAEEILELTGHLLLLILAAIAPTTQTRSIIGSSPINGNA